jgi:hypothetical protein
MIEGREPQGAGNAQQGVGMASHRAAPFCTPYSIKRMAIKNRGTLGTLLSDFR